MNPALTDRISELPTLNRVQLLPIWEENFNTQPPATIGKLLMVRILAYRMQEREYGGLSHSARKRLKEIAHSLKGSRKPPRENASALGAGTKIIRIWRGEAHEVFSTGDGYRYRGQEFRSLSKIAKEITGTHWSGPAFFGTKKKAK